MKRVCFWLFVLIPLLAAGLTAQTLNDANQAFHKHNITKAVQLYQHVLNEAEDPNTRAKAELRLANIEWRFYLKADEARSRLIRAASDGARQADLLIELARLEIRNRNYGAAAEAAKRALLLAKTEDEELRARVHYAWAAVEEAKNARLGGDLSLDISTPGSKLLAPLQDAAALLKTIVKNEPGLLQPSRLLLTAALLLGDGESALEGWRSYYRVAQGREAPGLLRKPQAVLEDLLHGWNTCLDPEKTERLVHALSDSKLLEEAAVAALKPSLKKEELAGIDDIVAYAMYIRRIGEITNEYYRKTAIGQGKPVDYIIQIIRVTVENWEALSLQGPPPELAVDDEEKMASCYEQVRSTISEVFKKRYRAIVNFGNTAGYFDLHMGHAVIDEERKVEQYGHCAKIRFVSLDGIVSNGFQSWAWDYKSQHGGWGTAESIVQIRPAYADGPLKRWRQISDPQQRKLKEERISMDSSEDDRRVEKNPITFLPGLAGRLRLAALDNLKANLSLTGLDGATLRTSFIAELERIVREYSIFAHEGRHVIDKRLGVTNPEELEFRAKLSEIAFSSYPRLALCSGILSENMGSNTPHGRANLRVIKGLVCWMGKHADQIDGLDDSEPLLPQLDLLSDDQLREAARSMDPLAK